MLIALILLTSGAYLIWGNIGAGIVLLVWGCLIVLGYFFKHWYEEYGKP